MIRAVILTAAVCVSPIVAQDAPPKLEPVFSDDFSTDTRADYRVTGDVSWELSQLTLPEGASIERIIDGGAWALVRLIPEAAPPTAQQAASEWRVWFVLADAPDCCLRFRSERRNEQITHSIALLEVRDQAGQTEEQVLREVNVGEVPQGTVEIEYRNGLVRVVCSQELLFAASSEERGGTVNSVRTESPLSATRLRSYGISATQPELREFTVAQQQELDRASGLNEKLTELWQQGQFAEAAMAGEQALQIREALLGKTHPGSAECKNNLGTVYFSQGDLLRAEQCYKQAAAVMELHLGDYHPDYAQVLNGLGAVYFTAGDYPRALPNFIKATAIFESVLGAEHPLCATSQLNLGTLYLRVADYRRAEKFMAQGVEAFRAILGKDHPSYANSLSNYGGLCYSMGDYDRAELLYKQALQITESGLGEAHPQTATDLHNLGELYRATGKYAEAERYLKQALDRKTESLGDHHTSVAATLSSLAQLHLDTGDYSRAESFQLQSVTVNKVAGGEQHPDYAISLNQLALVHRRRGGLALAEPLLEQALTIQKTVIGEDHPDYVVTLASLASLRHELGDAAGAEALIRRAANTARRNLEVNSVWQPERQQKRNQALKRWYLDRRLTWALGSDVSVEDLLHAHWNWKGAVTLRQRAYRRAAADPKVAPLFESLQAVTRQLSVTQRRAPAPPTPNATAEDREKYDQSRKTWEQKLAALVAQREDLEQQVASASREFGAFLTPLTVAEVTQALPPGTAMIDFLECEPALHARREKTRSYVAFVVKPDHEPVMVGLDSSVRISAAIMAFRRPLAGEGDAGQALAAARTLREQVWLPLERHLDGVETVIVSPDTALGTLPFAALPGSEPGTYLIERYKFVSLPLARMLQSQRPAGPDPKQGLLVLGDVDYDAQVASVGSGSDAPTTTASEQPQLAESRPADVRQWSSLPGFRRELEEVSSLYRQRYGGDAPVVILTGTNATEGSLLQAATQSATLHVITHGFFEDETVKSIDQVELNQEEISRKAGSDPFINTWLPGLLSGLVLAGANTPPENLNDGILRAAEIEATSLQGVDLVVLSACETGLGAVAGGEGLTGLQRAFHIAGVRSVVSSLWRVDDRATQELMRQFYTNLWIRQQSKVDALRNAQLWMLNNPDKLAELGVKQSRSRGVPRRRVAVDVGEAPKGRTSPFFWAAFTLSGDWR